MQKDIQGNKKQGPVSEEKTELEQAYAEVAKALRRMVAAQLGPDASFEQYEALTETTMREAMREAVEDWNRRSGIPRDSMESPPGRSVSSNLGLKRDKSHGKRTSRTGQPPRK